MTVRKIFIGSLGPYLYDDAKQRPDQSGLQGLICEGSPIGSSDVLRLGDVGGGGPASPSDATYVVMSLDADLSQERRLQVGDSLSLTDSGANADVTLDAIQDIRTSASPTLTNLTLSGVLNTAEVRAKDANGLKLYDDSGTKGLQILDNGYGYFTDRVGIGTSSPLANAHINNDFFIAANSSAWSNIPGKGIYVRYSIVSGQDEAYIQSIDRSTSIRYPLYFQASKFSFGTGRVGIGTATPTHPLTIAFSSADGSTGAYPGIGILNTSTATHSFSDVRLLANNSDSIGHLSLDGLGSGGLIGNADPGLWIGTRTATDILAFGVNSTEYMRIDLGGNVGIGEDTPNKLLTLKDEGDAGSKTFTSGWTESGWQLGYVNSQYEMELDSLRVRGELHVYDLIINQIHSQNGGLIVSAGHGKADSVSGSAPNEDVTLDSPTGLNACSFRIGDIVLVQWFNINQTTVVKQCVRRVDTDPSSKVVSLEGVGGAPGQATNITPGDVLVVIGNDGTTANRDSSIFMSAVDGNNPFIRIFDGVITWANWKATTKTRVAVGNLNGTYGYSTEVYGFAAGEFAASPGKQYFSIDPTNGLRIKQYQSGWKTLLVASADLLQVGDTADKFKYVPSTNELTVAGWMVNASAIEKLTSNVGVKLDAANAKIQIGDLDNQHLDLLGADGKMKWYKSGGALTITIDSAIYGSWPGIKMASGAIHLEHTSLDSYILPGFVYLLSSGVEKMIHCYQAGDAGDNAIRTVYLETANAGNGQAIALWINAGMAFKPGGGDWSDTASDRRLKKDIADYTPGLNELLQLNPVGFQYNGLAEGAPNDGRTYIGLIAQDAEKIIPALVSKHQGELGGKRVKNLRMMDTSELKYMTINATKELHARIVELESEVTTLKQQIAIA